MATSTLRRLTGPTVDGLLALGLLGCGLALVFPHLGAGHWLLMLFENTPMQVGCVLLVILAVAMATGRRRLALATVLLFIPTLLHLSYYLVPRPFPDEPANLRAVSFNVLTHNQRHDEVLEFLQSTDADLIAVVEINGEWLESLAPLLQSHPHTAHFPGSHNFGIGMFSKYPILKFRRPMPTPGHPLLIAELDYHGSLLTVMVAHPVPPMNTRAFNERERYVRQCAELARSRPGPVLLMGDFNTTPWSPLFAHLVNTTGLRDSGKGRGYQATWQRGNPLFALPLDHVFHSAELAPVARRIGPACGSDHSPVVVDFAFSPTLPVPEIPAAPSPRRATQPAHPGQPTDPERQPRVRRVPDS